MEAQDSMVAISSLNKMLRDVMPSKLNRLQHLTVNQGRVSSSLTEGVVCAGARAWLNGLDLGAE